MGKTTNIWNFRYICQIQADNSTETLTLDYGGYLIISNLEHWSDASGIWYASINIGNSKISNIVPAEHCSLSISGKTLSWQADSFGSVAVIYKVW